MRSMQQQPLYTTYVSMYSFYFQAISLIINVEAARRWYRTISAPSIHVCWQEIDHTEITATHKIIHHSTWALINSAKFMSQKLNLPFLFESHSTYNFPAVSRIHSNSIFRLKLVLERWMRALFPMEDEIPWAARCQLKDYAT